MYLECRRTQNAASCASVTRGPQAVAVDDRVAEIEILDDTLELGASMTGARYSLQVRSLCHATPAWTSSITNRTPWLSEGFSHSIRLKIFPASSNLPSRQRHSPNPFRQRRNGRLSIHPHGSRLVSYTHLDVYKRQPSIRLRLVTKSRLPGLASHFDGTAYCSCLLYTSRCV